MTWPRLTVAVCLLAGSVSQAVGQTAAPAQPEFEVVSIKASAPLTTPQVSAGIHVDGAQVHCALLSVRDYIRIAYKVQDYQIAGPEWMASARYDIDAKLPAGATRDQVPDMIKALLADRMGMRTHTQARDLPVYALGTGRGGVKMKALPRNPEGNLDLQKSLVNTDATGTASGSVINFGNGSSISISAADRSIAGTKITMDNLAHVLGRFEDRPVIDQTGLTGIYNIDLTLSAEDFQVLMIRAAVAQGVVLPPQALALLDSGGDASLRNALDRLGLALDATKAPVNMLEIDHIQKPAGNE